MRSMLVSIALGLSVLGVACGGGGKEASTAESTKADLTPMDELKAIPADLDLEVKGLTKPIDDVQSTLDKLSTMPKRYKINAADLAAMVKGTVDDGKVEVKVSSNLPDEARAELEAALKELGDEVVALKQTPDKVVALTTKLGAYTAKVPVLATKVTASAHATIANPFGGADAKAKAQAELAKVDEAKTNATKAVSDAQAKITGIPAMATGALAKVTASFKGG